MRIPCNFCGDRDISEFTYLGGDEVRQRPDPAAPDAAQRFYEAVYLRENRAGPQDELWHHNYGCRQWLRVTRNTRTHEILAVAPARPDGTR